MFISVPICTIVASLSSSLQCIDRCRWSLSKIYGGGGSCIVNSVPTFLIVRMIDDFKGFVHIIHILCHQYLKGFYLSGLHSVLLTVKYGYE